MAKQIFSTKKIAIYTLVLLALLTLLYVSHDSLKRLFFSPRTTTAELGKSLTQPLSGNTDTTSDPNATTSAIPATPQVIAQSLTVPWEVVELPDGSLLVTERPGTLLHLTADAEQRTTVSGVEHVGEGGLLGLALDPDFSTNNWLYLYLTTRTDDGLTNRIERYTFDAAANTLTSRQVILDEIPGAQYHDGGRIAFAPDGYLYVTTGDAQDEALAQDTNSLAGKILRMTATGEPAPENPFGNYTYSYGHRNPQGLAWDAAGRLWSSEHGPSGTQTGYDEINVITAGGNYGWPEVKGDQTRDGMIAPVLHSGSVDTWAPGDIAVLADTVYFTGLRGESLYTAQISEKSGEVSLENFTAHLRSDLGRIRTVQVGSAGQLYLTTSNTDGRGAAGENDDVLIEVSPQFFE